MILCILGWTTNLLHGSKNVGTSVTCICYARLPTMNLQLRCFFFFLLGLHSCSHPSYYGCICPTQTSEGINASHWLKEWVIWSILVLIVTGIVACPSIFEAYPIQRTSCINGWWGPILPIMGLIFVVRTCIHNFLYYIKKMFHTYWWILPEKLNKF